MWIRGCVVETVGSVSETVGGRGGVMTVTSQIMFGGFVEAIIHGGRR